MLYFIYYHDQSVPQGELLFADHGGSLTSNVAHAHAKELRVDHDKPWHVVYQGISLPVWDGVSPLYMFAKEGRPKGEHVPGIAIRQGDLPGLYFMCKKEELYYIVSPKHSDRGAVWTLWRPNSAGYTDDLGQAGLYRRGDVSKDYPVWGETEYTPNELKYGKEVDNFIVPARLAQQVGKVVQCIRRD